MKNRTAYKLTLTEANMAKAAMATIITLLAMATLLPLHTNALVPYSRSLFDLMLPQEDPFKILEHTPLSIPRTITDPTSVALAHADWKETPTEHVISLDIPGMKKEEVKIEVEDNRVLRVSGERKSEDEVKDEKWHRVERTVGKFWRQFRMPRDADLEKVAAVLEDGVLRITVPKLAEKERKRETKVVSIGGGSGDDKVATSKHEL